MSLFRDQQRAWVDLAYSKLRFFWLPNEIKDSCKRAQDMLYVEERNLGIPRDKMARATRLIPFDGKPDTAFRSPLTLDMLRDVSALYAHTVHKSYYWLTRGQFIFSGRTRFRLHLMATNRWILIGYWFRYIYRTTLLANLREFVLI